MTTQLNDAINTAKSVDATLGKVLPTALPAAAAIAAPGQSPAIAASIASSDVVYKTSQNAAEIIDTKLGIKYNAPTNEPSAVGYLGQVTYGNIASPTAPAYAAAQVTKQVGSDYYKQRQQRQQQRQLELASPQQTPTLTPQSETSAQPTSSINVDTSSENKAVIGDLVAPQAQATGGDEHIPLHKKVKRGLKIIVLVLLIVCLCIIIYILGCVVAHTCAYDDNDSNYNHNYNHDSSDENSSQYNSDRVFP